MVTANGGPGRLLAGLERAPTTAGTTLNQSCSLAAGLLRYRMACGCRWRRDGSEKQVDAGGGGNRDGDWESGSQGASGGQGGVDGQTGAGGYCQAGGGFEAAVAEDHEAVEASVALGVAGTLRAKAASRQEVPASANCANEFSSPTAF